MTLQLNDIAENNLSTLYDHCNWLGCLDQLNDWLEFSKNNVIALLYHIKVFLTKQHNIFIPS